MITLNNNEFCKNLEEIAQTFDLDLNQVIRKTGMDLFAGIVEETPVETGFLKSRWEINLDYLRDMPSTDIPPTERMTDGEIDAANKAQEATLTGYGDLRDIYISNNLPYAINIEYRGSPNKKPHGMVWVTLVKVEAELNAELRKFKFYGGLM